MGINIRLISENREHLYHRNIHAIRYLTASLTYPPTHKYTHADVLKVDVCRHDLGKDYDSQQAPTGSTLGPVPWIHTH